MWVLISQPPYLFPPDFPQIFTFYALYPTKFERFPLITKLLFKVEEFNCKPPEFSRGIDSPSQGIDNAVEYIIKTVNKFKKNILLIISAFSWYQIKNFCTAENLLRNYALTGYSLQAPHF